MSRKEENLDYDEFDDVLDDFDTSSPQVVKQGTTTTSSTTGPTQQMDREAMEAEADADLTAILEGMTEDDKKMCDLFQESYEALNGELESFTSSKKTTKTKKTEQKEEKTINESMKEFINVLNNSYKEPTTTTRAEEEPLPEQSEALFKEMMEMMMNMGEGGDDQGDEGGDLPEEGIVLKLLENILHPDILASPIEELSKQYVIYLNKHQNDLSKQDRAAVEEQYKQTKKIIALYQQKNYPASLPAIIDAFKDMQDAGTPPDEIVNALTEGGSTMPDMRSLMGGF